MGSKAEIGWVRRDESGERWDLYAQPVGRDWKFFARQRRYEVWQPLETPILEDWLELLDALRENPDKCRQEEHLPVTLSAIAQTLFWPI